MYHNHVPTPHHERSHYGFQICSNKHKKGRKAVMAELSGTARHISASWWHILKETFLIVLAWIVVLPAP